MCMSPFHIKYKEYNFVCILYGIIKGEIMKKISKLSLLLMTSLLVSCNNSSPTGEWITFSSSTTFITTTKNTVVFPFNTVMSVLYYKEFNNKEISEDFYTNLETLFLDNVVDLHKKVDRHHYYYDKDESTIVTNIKTVNDSYATGEEIFCSEELYNLLKLGHKLTLETNGLFNFYMGQLTSYWDYVLEEVSYDPNMLYELDPYFSSSSQGIVNDLKLSSPTLKDIENIMTFNDENKSVIFNAIEDLEGYERSQNNSQFRPIITSGGIAKGYATDIIKDILVSNGYTKGFINSGSSSITSLSKFDYVEPYYQNMSITDPRTANGFLREVAVTVKLYEDYSLSTSANYTSDKSYYFTTEDNKRIYRHHIINPYTGESSLHHASVTLISNTFTNGELDAFSTAFVNASIEESRTLRETLLSLYPNHDLSYVIMDVDNNDNMQIYISNSLKENTEVKGEKITITYE